MYPSQTTSHKVISKSYSEMLNRYFNFTRGNFLALVLFRNQILFTILVLRHADSFESMGNGDPRPLEQLLMKEEIALKRMYAKYR